MRIKKLLVKWLSVSVLAAILFVYLNNFSPYKEDGSLNPVVILVAFSILAILSFFILKAFFSLFFRHQTASQGAFIISFVLMQVILISNWSFINLSSILVILFFNLFICWYAIKIL